MSEVRWGIGTNVVMGQIKNLELHLNSTLVKSFKSMHSIRCDAAVREVKLLDQRIILALGDGLDDSC